MTTNILHRIDDLVTRIQSYQGHAQLLDEKIDSLVYGYNSTKQALQRGVYDLESHLSTLERINALIQEWIRYRNNSEYVKVLDFLQRVADDLASSFPATVRPMVLLGERDHLISISTGGFPDFFVESHYLTRKSLSYCYSIAHEIGHILFIQYAYDASRMSHLISSLGEPIWKKLRKLAMTLSPDALELWARCWLSELVADAFSATKMGAESINREAFDANLAGVPLQLGTDTHPPLGFRIELMRERILDIARTCGHKSRSLGDLKKLKLPSKFEMMTNGFFQRALKDKKYNRNAIIALMRSTTPSTISNKLAFDKEVIKTAVSLVDEIMNWGTIGHNFNELEDAREALNKGINPSCGYSTKLAALLDITQGFPNTRLERVLTS